jgi:DNA polymerase-3 subunit epsilon
MDFVALDFETANPSFSSVCQVGAAVFVDGQLTDTFSSLVDPEDYFHPVNISIHGLDEDAVRGAPAFPEVYRRLSPLLADKVVVCHSSFDRTVMTRSTARFGLQNPSCRWLDSTRVVRRTWPQYAARGYGLANLAADLGIAFTHHDATEDARATGLVLLRALAESGLSIEEWFARIEQPIDLTTAGPISRAGDPNGILYGEVVVFTGALSLPRREAADLAAAVGCEVDPGVTKRTTLLVVGDQDVSKLADGQTKSAKHLKAEALAAAGAPIRIVGESDFSALVSFALPHRAIATTG